MTDIIESGTVPTLRSGALRNMLLMSVATSALMFGYGRSVQAASYAPPDHCSVSVDSITVTCTGDLGTDGIAVTADKEVYTTLEVNSLTADIAPVDGTRGIFLTTNVAPPDGELNHLTIVSDTGDYTITTKGNGADGVAIIVNQATAPSVISITHSGDITTDGNNANAIRATAFFGKYVEGRSVTVISEGDFTTKGTNLSRGIHAEGDFSAISITHTGDIITHGLGRENQGILARNYGVNADPDGEGDIMVWHTGDITTYGSTTSQGILAIQDIGRDGKIEIFSYGNITTWGTGAESGSNHGISASADNGSNVFITQSGDITVHGTASAIRANAAVDGAHVAAYREGNTKGDITITVTDSNLISKRGRGVQIENGVDNTLNIYGTVTIAGDTEYYAEYYDDYLEEYWATYAEYLESDEYAAYAESLRNGEEPDLPDELEDPADPTPNADIQSGSGNETINIYGHLTSPGNIDLRWGNDTITIHNDGSLTSGGTIDLGNGDDAIHNYGSLSTGGTIDLGMGDNGFHNYAGAVSDGLRLVVGFIPDEDDIDSSIDYSGTLTITNEGTIDGGDADFAIHATGGDITVDNSGVIIGDVQLGEGDDTFILRTGGTLDGDLDMGDVEVVVVDEVDDVVVEEIDTFILTGDVSEDGSDIFAGNVTGAEFLFKTGGGTWALDGVADISLITMVSEGRLNVGSTADCTADACILNTPSVVVYDGAILGGHGRVMNNFDDTGLVTVMVQSGGTIAPGTSLGTLTIEGEVLFEDGAIFEAELNDSPDQDLLNIVGSGIDISPATLKVVTNSSFDPTVSTDFVILEVEKGYTIDGDFAEFDYQFGPAVDPQFRGIHGKQNDDRQYIIHTLAILDEKSGPANRNSVAGYINDLAPYGFLSDLDLETHETILGVISGITGDGHHDQLNTFSPEWINAISEVGFSFARNSIHAVHDRLSVTDLSGNDQSARLVSDSAAGSSGDTAGGLWLSGGWTTSDVDGGSEYFSYDYDILSVFLGFDYRIHEDLLLGVMAGYQDADIDYDDLDNTPSVESIQGTAYVSYSPGQWGIDLMGGYGSLNVETDHLVAYGTTHYTATADYDGDYHFVSARISYDVALDDGWHLTPEVSAAYTKVNQDGFTETGAVDAELQMLVDEHSAKSVRLAAQARISKTFDQDNGHTLTPYLRVGIAQELKDNPRLITAGFTAQSNHFDIYGDAPRGTSALFGVGLVAVLSDSWALFIDYSGQIGGDFKSHSVGGGARINF